MKKENSFFSLHVNLWGMLSSAVCLACAATIAGFFGRFFWIFDFASSFRIQYFVCLGMASFVFMAGKKRKAALVTGIFSTVNFILLVPFYLHFPVPHAAEGKMFRAVQANVHGANTDYERFIHFVDDVSPDFIAVEEYTFSWDAALKKLHKKYPYVVSHPQGDNFGIAFFSRIPFKSAEIKNIGPIAIPSTVARFEFNGRVLNVIGTHPVPPNGGQYVDFRNKQIESVGLFVKNLKGNVVILGDLNITPWTPALQDFLRIASLRDAREGYGVTPTWPVDSFLFIRFPIDYCLVSRDVSVRDFKRGPDIGSDHFPLVMDFSFAH